MPNYPYSFQLPPLSTQDIPNNGAVGEFLGISAGGVLDWLPVSAGAGDMLKADNLSGLASYPTARTNLGLGLTDSPTFKNLAITTGSIATSAPVTISQTWNDAAVAFTAFKVNATTPGTTSSSSSLLLDLQVGGVSKFSINKAGELTMNSAADPGTYISNPYLGFLFFGGNARSFFLGQDGSGNGLANMSSIGSIGFSSVAIPTYNNSDVRLWRDAANTLALRNSTAAQTFRVYNTFLGTTANEWFEIDWKVSAGTVRLFTMHGGTGVARNIDISAGGTLFFGAGTSSPIKMYSGGSERWNISATGHFIAATDNTYDIGASGANRPRNVYVGSNVISRPAASITPANNSELVVEATSNTTLTFKLKGTDGTVRSATLTLAP
jgi:hypothetical protein